MQEMVTQTPNSQCDNHTAEGKKLDPPGLFPKNECKFLLSVSKHIARMESSNSQLTEILKFGIYDVQFTWDLNIWPVNKLNNFWNVQLSCKTEIQEYALLTVDLGKS